MEPVAPTDNAPIVLTRARLQILFKSMIKIADQCIARTRVADQRTLVALADVVEAVPSRLNELERRIRALER